MTGPVNLQPSGPPTPARPTAVTVVGILAVVGGALALLSLPMVVAMLCGVLPQPKTTPSLFDDPLYRSWVKINIPLALVVAPLWIATGVGLLRMRRWARTTIMVLLPLGVVTHLVYTTIVLRFFLQTPAGGPFEARLQRIMLPAMTLFSGVLGIAYVFVLLYLMTRPKVVTAFRQAQPSR